LAIAAAARKSSIRLLCTTDEDALHRHVARSVFGFSCMYCSARSTARGAAGRRFAPGRGRGR